VIGVLALLGLVGALAAGTLPRLRQQQRLQAAAARASTEQPRVTVAVARSAGADAERVLPGSSLPLLETGLYARATGYVAKRLVDIGDRVQEGQLLAVIAAPDVDDQLAQAKANLAQAKANLKVAEANADLAQVTLDRDLAAGLNTTVTAQQIDQDRATVKATAAQVVAAQASIKVNEATVQRYADLQGFQQIVAPFTGVITARNVDPGDLITADSPSTAREMFHLMRTDTLRVLVSVPQVYARSIRVDQDALVFPREDPRKQYKGKVTRTADALDPATRTLLTEVQVPNADNALRAGMYLQVKFVFNREVRPVLIPAAALVTRSEGSMVGVLDSRNQVHHRTVQLGRDYGAEIEVISGLDEGETVVVSPGDVLPEGTTVQPAPLGK
jgi:RND family efflux transporter MFP subunit